MTITNAGVSGDTTSAGLSRVDWSVPDGTQGVIVELGANDALRGISPEQTEKNLDAILSRLKERKISGSAGRHTRASEHGWRLCGAVQRLYKRLAEKYQVPLYPFFLDGVVLQKDLQLEDGMHPNAKGVAVMVARSLPVVEDFVRTIVAPQK